MYTYVYGNMCADVYLYTYMPRTRFGCQAPRGMPCKGMIGDEWASYIGFYVGSQLFPLNIAERTALGCSVTWEKDTYFWAQW